MSQVKPTLGGTLSTGLSGVAGEYFVAAELSRRGYIATLTLRNARGIDILVANETTTESVGVQVKTNQGSERTWMLTKKAESQTVAHLVLVFVNLNGLTGQPSYHVVPGEVVRQHCARTHAEWLASPGRGGRPHVDMPMRHFEDLDCKYLDAWHLLGLG